MGKSRTVSVTVSPKSAELTIGLDRAGGLPGVVKFYGSLFQAGTIILIRGATVELWVNGVKVKTTTTGILGRYHFDYTVGAGIYDFFSRFPGNDTYLPDDSPRLQGVYSKIPASLSIDVNPTFGAPPLAVTILGRLSRDDTTAGLPGKTAELYRNGVKIKSMTTKTTSPGQGSYEFHDTISTKGDYEYYVYFAGDAQFEGCEAHDGATADGEPPDDEEPTPAGLGAGALILALLVLSQES